MEIAFNVCRSDVFAATCEYISFYKITLEYDSQLDRDNLVAYRFSQKDTDMNTEVKCMAWHPSLDCCDVIALGHTNGRVILKSAGFEEYPLHSPCIGGEYVPKYPKQCNGLAWNSFLPQWLAIGLEKSRYGSLVIWDVNARNEMSQQLSERNKISTELTPSPNTQSSVAKPLLEIAQGDSVNSLMWLKQDTLVVGINRKNLRIYDMRTPSTYSSSVLQHKATFGLCVDPTMDHRFACFGENCISVWDSRNFTKPATLISTHQNISKIQWCPTRHGMLAALLTSSNEGFVCDSNTMCVYDMMSATYPDEDLEVAGYHPVLRTVNPEMPGGDWITGFSWLPTASNCLMTASSAASFHFNFVPESTSVQFRSRHHFGIASGCNMLMLDHKDEDDKATDNDTIPMVEKDMIRIIYERAKNGYGLTEDAILKAKELSLDPNNFSLHLMWQWICRMKRLCSNSSYSPSLNQSNSPQSPVHWSSYARIRPVPIKPPSKTVSPSYFSGIQGIFKDLENPDDATQTTMETIPWIGVSGTKSKVYTSKKRNEALLLCDWGNSSKDSKGGGDRFGRNSIGEGLVRRLQLSGATERACAVALWHLDMKLAIEILNMASNSSSRNHSKYSAVAMALSGYTGVNCPTLWLDTCRRLQNELESPYLQMAFAFLIACAEDSKVTDTKNGKFDAILSNKNILLQDRIAFACMYLPDILLSTYITSLSDDVIQDGSLDGVLVTGLSTPSGVKLLQKYIDNTGDVQTPLVAIIHGCQPVILQRNADVLHWKESYTQLLNKWQLYIERVDFDLMWSRASEVQKTTTQIYLHCNYCNKSISTAPNPTNKSLSPSRSVQQTSLQRSHFKTRHHSDPALNNRRSPRVLHNRHRYHSSPTRVMTSPRAGRGRSFMGGGLAHNSITSCPSCGKPLPRCSVCSMHLGTRNDETDISQWISWCMKCRHGGHQGHLDEWFKTNLRCPATDCKCYCDSDLPTAYLK